MHTKLKDHLGFGLGLRKEHFHDIIETRPKVDWFEILTENYLVPGGKPLYYLDQIHQDYPMVMHGVSLSIGNSDELDFNYLKQVKQLASRIDAQWISDHLCWTGMGGSNAHDLLPLPYTQESVKHVVNRIKQVQDYLQQPILMENVSSYISYQQSEMTEWEFLSNVAEQADCLILLDINNIFVTAVNHKLDARTYIDAIPKNRVQQFHLAGHTDFGDYIIDTHDHDIRTEVWDLYQYAVNRFGSVTTMIERDDHIPPLSELVAELDTARTIAAKQLELMS